MSLLWKSSKIVLVGVFIFVQLKKIILSSFSHLMISICASCGPLGSRTVTKMIPVISIIYFHNSQIAEGFCTWLCWFQIVSCIVEVIVINTVALINYWSVCVRGRWVC